MSEFGVYFETTGLRGVIGNTREHNASLAGMVPVSAESHSSKKPGL